MNALDPRRARFWMGVAWPGFLVACALELLVFGLVDPRDLHWAGDPLALSRQAVYTLGFFAFWALAGCAGALSLLLAGEGGERRGPLSRRPGDSPGA